MLRPFKQSLEIVFFQPTPAIRVGGFLATSGRAAPGVVIWRQ